MPVAGYLVCLHRSDVWCVHKVGIPSEEIFNEEEVIPKGLLDGIETPEPWVVRPEGEGLF